jgi:hypothetical protein
MSRLALPNLQRAFCDGERFGNETMHAIEAGGLLARRGLLVDEYCVLGKGLTHLVQFR